MSNSEEFITFEDAVKILKEELDFPPDRALHYVKKFDANNDGKLSIEEFAVFKNKIEETKTTLVPKFKEFDADGNGYITLDEAAVILQKPPFQFPAERIVGLLKKFDVDDNGKLDIEEFAEFYAEAKALNSKLTACFEELDQDKNGVLSPEEVTKTIQKLMHFEDDEYAKLMVNMFDKNHDGNLDKSEFIAMWGNLFA